MKDSEIKEEIKKIFISNSITQISINDLKKSSPILDISVQRLSKVCNKMCEENILKDMSGLNTSLPGKQIFSLIDIDNIVNEQKQKGVYIDQKKESNEWKKTAKIVFKPFISTLSELYTNFELSNIPSNISGYTLEQRAEMVFSLHYKEHKEFLNNYNEYIEDAKYTYGISDIIMPNAYSLYIFKDNIYAEIAFDFRKDSDIELISRVTYHVLSEYDRINVIENEKNIDIDVSIPFKKEKDINVTHSALIGNMLGGISGAIIGSTYATEKNKKNAEYANNYKPIIVDTKVKDYKLEINLYKECDKDLIRFCTTAIEDGILDKSIQIFQNAIKKESFIKGKILKEYVIEQNINSFEENDYKLYEEKRMVELRDERISKYYEQHPEKKELLLKKIKENEEQIHILKEKILPEELEIKKINNSFNYFQQEKTNELNSTKQKITTLKNELKNLGILNFKEKKNIKLKCKELEELIDEKEKEYKKNEMDAKQKIEKIKEGILPELQKIEELTNKLNYYTDELTRDRLDM